VDRKSLKREGDPRFSATSMRKGGGKTPRQKAGGTVRFQRRNKMVRNPSNWGKKKDHRETGDYDHQKIAQKNSESQVAGQENRARSLKKTGKLKRRLRPRRSGYGQTDKKNSNRGWFQRPGPPQFLWSSCEKTHKDAWHDTGPKSGEHRGKSERDGAPSVLGRGGKTCLNKKKKKRKTGGNTKRGAEKKRHSIV